LLFQYLDLLRVDVQLFVVFFGAVVTALVAGLSFHEFSHALVADALGDGTARAMGRLTLNPKAHLDPAGTLFMLLIGFGWGKPVPVNPARLRNGRQGMTAVAAAGPVSNLLLAALAAAPIKLGWVPWVSPFVVFASTRGWTSADYLGLFLSALVSLNLILCVFNFLPLPPLDGFGVFSGLLPIEAMPAMRVLEQYGFGILMLLLFLPAFTNINILTNVLSPTVDGLARFLTGR